MTLRNHTMRDLLSKLDAVVKETALRNKEDLEAKRQALNDLEADPIASNDPEISAAIDQRRSDLEKEAKSKGFTEDEDVYQVGDDFGISFSEDFEIATEIVDILEDGIVIDLDETALNYLSENGFTFEDIQLDEEKQKGLDGKACWKGYRRMGTKMKGGKRVDNCVKVGEDSELEEKSFPFAGKAVGHKEGPAGWLKGKDKRPAKAGDLVGEESFNYNFDEDSKADLEKGSFYIVNNSGQPMSDPMNKYGDILKFDSKEDAFNFYNGMSGREMDEYDVVVFDGNKFQLADSVDEAKYQGREVPLGKPMKGDVKKSKVYVRGPKGNVVKVNFGDKKMRIKKSNPNRRKSFRARHNCSNPGPRWKARYWSCRAW